MTSEIRLYKSIARFADEHLGCHTVKQQVGTRYGRIDVVGLREVHSDYLSSPEIIGIEVKEEGATFLSSLGQSLAYSLYAHQCYLAVRKRHSNAFTSDEKRMAAKFGVGLIEIKARGCSLVQSSRMFDPEPSFVAHRLKTLGFFQCVMCGGTYKSEDISYSGNYEIDLPKKPRYRGNLSRAIKQGKNMAYYLFRLSQGRREEDRYYVYDRRFLCRDCASLFASLLPKEKE